MIEEENLPSGVSERLKSLHKTEKEHSLYLWQEGAIQAWSGTEYTTIMGDKEEKEPYRGIFAAVTGAGKTLAATECIWGWLQDHPLGQVTVLVPNRGLQRQWKKEMEKAFPTMKPIGTLGGGRRDFRQITVAVMNTAAKGLPYSDGDHLMVVDECHNIGSDFRQYAMRNNEHSAVLGLSATPAREDHGQTNDGEQSGPVIYEYGYEQGIEDGVIVPFRVRAVEVPLTHYERHGYYSLTQEIRKVSFILRKKYGNSNWFSIREDPDDPDMALTTFKDLCMRRKRLTNECHFRAEAVDDILRLHDDNKTMIFHERIKQIEWMHEKYSGSCPPTLFDCETDWEGAGVEEPDCSEWVGLWPEIYHGERTKSHNDRALERFSEGDSKILLSCKALREGIDVPACDLGIMVSGTNSARARVQTLGRCLRRAEDKNEAIVYLLYVPNTTDAKGLRNLKYGGKLPDGIIEWWKYDPQKGLSKQGEEERPELPKRKPQQPKEKHLCESCYKTFHTESAARPENHHCYPRLGRTGRKQLDLRSDMIGRKR